MKAYIDSSVVLRLVLGQPDALAEWRTITEGVASRLTAVECLRTLDRLRSADVRLSAEELSARRAAALRVIDALRLVDISAMVLDRAAQPTSVPLGTLDAIHFATARLWREEFGRGIVFATHDRSLGLAAQADGFDVVGT